MNQNTLFYLHDYFNIHYDIRMIIKKEMEFMDLCRTETRITKYKYREVIKHIEYYAHLNKMINKRKKTTYNLLSTINHFDKP